MSAPKALVFGGSGAQGGPVIAELIRRGWKVAAATRNPLGAARLALLGATVIELDLRDAERLAKQADAADGVFVHLPMRPMGAAGAGLARAAIGALSRAARPRVVFSTSGPVLRGRGLPVMMRGVAEAMHRLHLLAPPPMNWTVLQPGLFIEDVLDCRPAETMAKTGVLRYPLPADVAVRWTSCAAVARATADIFEGAMDGDDEGDEGEIGDEIDGDDGDDGGEREVGDSEDRDAGENGPGKPAGLTIVHPLMSEPATGPVLAAAFASVLGLRALRYEAWPPAAYAATLLESTGDGEYVEAIEELYRALADQRAALVAPGAEGVAVESLEGLIREAMPPRA